MLVTRRMSKRLASEGPNSTLKSLRTDTSSCSNSIQSPYFTLQVSEPTTNSQDNRETQKSTEKDIKEQQQAQKIDTLITDEVKPSGSSHLSSTKLGQDFYEQNCITLSKALLGQIVVRVVNGVRISGRIVETESYLGTSDSASHSYNGRRTCRTEAMYMKPGTSYVYTIYGMYYCFNITSKEEGSCVLIRALEPLEGLEQMQVGRKVRRKDHDKVLKPHQLCSGPSKLCQALYLTKDNNNKMSLTESDDFWLEGGIPVPESNIVVCKRVGIEGSGPESANKLQRFYELNSKFVSVRDKTAEKQMVLE